LLHQELARLTPVARNLLALRHFDRLSAHEIATQMGIPEDEVLLRLFNAVQKLSLALGNVCDTVH
jgi:DNA-directed RNA polymerase specialized sigma24 family protein